MSNKTAYKNCATAFVHPIRQAENRAIAFVRRCETAFRRPPVYTSKCAFDHYVACGMVDDTVSVVRKFTFHPGTSQSAQTLDNKCTEV